MGIALGPVAHRAENSGAVSPAEVLGPLNDVEEKYAPKQLYWAGDLSLLKRGPRVSLVGSRKASPEGLARTRSLVRALVEHHIVVVSGLAEGIDTAAHMAAIEAGGRTIAVLGTPLDQSYPASNAALQASMSIDQLVISEFPAGYSVTPKNVPIRNRTVALLTDATVIVEAGEKSGTVHQGWEALRLGRLLFLLENVARDPSLSWPTKMIHYGAQVLTRDTLPLFVENVPSMTVRINEGLAAYA